eukprot:jgi/Mesvir1/12917/Mv05936-RA.1
MGAESGPPVNPAPPANPEWKTMNGSVAGPAGQWSTGCADCCDDGVFKCCMAFWFPCVTFGQYAEIVDGTPCAIAGGIAGILLYIGSLHCIYSYQFRGKIRQRFGIPGSEAGDCCMHWWCTCCSYLQEARELKVHGMTMPNSMNPPPVSYGAPPPVQVMGAGAVQPALYPQPPH